MSVTVATDGRFPALRVDTTQYLSFGPNVASGWPGVQARPQLSVPDGGQVMPVTSGGTYTASIPPT